MKNGLTYALRHGRYTLAGHDLQIRKMVPAFRRGAYGPGRIAGKTRIRPRVAATAAVCDRGRAQTKKDSREGQKRYRVSVRMPRLCRST